MSYQAETQQAPVWCDECRDWHAEDETCVEITYPREDRSDYRRALAQHEPDGEVYAVEYCSLWGINDQCVGARIYAAAGPLHRSDVLYGQTVLQGRLDRLELGTDDADWLQAEEDAGRLTYPWGA